MKTITGNLLDLFDDGKFNIIIHGCNCYNTMGSGIAKQIKQRYPGAAKADANTMKGNVAKLGWYSKYSLADDKIIINAYTQYSFKNNPHSTLDHDMFTYRYDRHVSYDAVYESFARIAKMVRFLNRTNYTIGYPMIGAGLGGGNWNIISTIINEALEGLDHTLVVLP